MNNLTNQPSAPKVEDGLIKYTDAIRTASSAVKAVYLDSLTNNLYFQFHNDTVSRREYDGSFHQLTAAIREHGGSIGKFWNETADKFRGSMTFYNIQDFELRDKVEAVSEAQSLIVSFEINAGWEDLPAIADAMRNAGHSARILGAQVNDNE